jgi:formylmethanofuran dehydrogenase subunit E
MPMDWNTLGKWVLAVARRRQAEAERVQLQAQSLFTISYPARLTGQSNDGESPEVYATGRKAGRRGKIVRAGTRHGVRRS